MNNKLYSREEAEKVGPKCRAHIIPKSMTIKYLYVTSEGKQVAVYVCPLCKKQSTQILSECKPIVCPECNGIPPEPIENLKELWKQPKCGKCLGKGFIFPWDKKV